MCAECLEVGSRVLGRGAKASHKAIGTGLRTTANLAANVPAEMVDQLENDGQHDQITSAGPPE